MADTGDPRLGIAPSSRDIRPIIERPRQGLSGVALAVIAIVLGVGLVGLLNVRRQAATAPATRIKSIGRLSSSAAPPLYLPPLPEPAAPYVPSPPRLDRVPPQPPSSSPSRQIFQPSAYVPQQTEQRVTPVLQRNAAGPTLIADSSTGTARVSENTAALSGGPASTQSTGRVKAGMFANRATTITQGTLIPAVLETAFDSANPGFARALVQFDVRGFDGTRILIPRGSRLIGEYGAATTRGQKRAVVLWLRLIRPDGVTIAIGSPAADPLGRGGVKADVDSHFLERFGGAILQSALDIGVNLASRATGSSTVVALPGALQDSRARPTEINPTLSVPAGRSISVFVARDLDFTDVEITR